MTRQKIYLLLPLSIAAALLIYCWTMILSTGLGVTWKHQLGLELFLVLIYCFFTSYKLTVIATGIYLLLATFNLLSMTATITTTWLRFGSFHTPPMQMLSFGIFILFIILNLDPLINIYLDYKEDKEAKVK